MKSSRGSSIPRSLAVALGRGMAFGVGVTVARSAGRPPAADLALLSRRLEKIEQWIAGSGEISPARAALPAPAAPAEQTHEMADRLAELEAHLATSLKTLEQQDQFTVSGVESRLAELTARVTGDLKVLEQQDQSTITGVEGRLAELEAHLATGLRTLEQQDQLTIAGVEGRLAELEARLATAVAAAEARLRGEASEAGRAAGFGEQLAPVTAALAERDREIADLRRRLMDNEETVLELVVALGRMRRQKGAHDSDGPPAEPPAT
jgi:hypothetical protein